MVEVASEHLFSRLLLLLLLFGAVPPCFPSTATATAAATAAALSMVADEARAPPRGRCSCDPERLVLDLADGHGNLLSARRPRSPPGRRLQRGQGLAADGGRGKIKSTAVEVAVGGGVAAYEAFRDRGCRAGLDRVSVWRDKGVRWHAYL